MKHKIFKSFKIVALLLSSIIIIVYIIFPICMGCYATFKYNSNVGEAPLGFENLDIYTSDEVLLKAWYLKPKNGAVVILIHGATSSRESIREYAKFLAENDYGVLTFDMRGHGESTGDTVNAYGWKGTKDIEAIVDYLSEHNIDRIGGLGISLGGEILLDAIDEIPKIRAVISDGATYRSINDYITLQSNRSLFRSFTNRLMYYSAQVISGDNPPSTIYESIKNSNTVPIFLIAAGDVKKEIDYNNMYISVASEKSKLWIVPDVGHTEAYNTYPEEYKKQVLEFLDSNLMEH